MGGNGQVGMTVYVDLYFMINFSMDFLCLFLTAKLLHTKASLYRLLLAAILGAAYAVTVLFLPFTSWQAMMLDVAACLLVSAVAFFSHREPYRTLLSALVFVLVSMVIGGIMTALFNLLNRSGLFDTLRGGGDGISVWMFAILAIISGAVTLLGGGFFKRRMARRSVEVEITLCEKTVRVRGMCDSGNLLRDPVGGRPCIVADRDALAPILPEGLYFASRTRSAEGVCSLPRELQRRIILIPTKTAVGDSVLIGIRADKVSLITGKGEHSVDAPIALTDLKDGAGEDRALVPAELLA